MASLPPSATPPHASITLHQPSPLQAYGPQGITLLSDLHVGSSLLDEERLTLEIDRAAANNDRVLINGDLCDLILTRDAKRFSPNALHPSIAGRDDLVNAAVEMTVKLLAPIASQIDMIGSGNHEWTVGKNHNVDVVALIINGLKPYGCTLERGGGALGMVRYEFVEPSYKGRKKKVVSSHTLLYWHGNGGSSSLTGVLGEFGNKGTFVEGVDSVWYGHKHVRAVSQMERIYWDKKTDRLERRRQWLLRTGGYLDAYHAVNNRSGVPSRNNYVSDNFLTPAARGGLRLVLSPCGSSTVEVLS